MFLTCVYIGFWKHTLIMNIWITRKHVYRETYTKNLSWKPLWYYKSWALALVTGMYFRACLKRGEKMFIRNSHIQGSASWNGFCTMGFKPCSSTSLTLDDRFWYEETSKSVSYQQTSTHWIGIKTLNCNTEMRKRNFTQKLVSTWPSSSVHDSRARFSVYLICRFYRRKLKKHG